MTRCFTLKGKTGSPDLVDVLGTLHGDLGQPGHVELPAAVGVHLDVELVGRMVPEQVPEGQQRRYLPAGVCSATRKAEQGAQAPEKNTPVSFQLCR